MYVRGFYTLVLGLLLLFVSNDDLMAQTKKQDKAFEEEYQKRIKKSRINDVYIPKDFQDAFVELKRLSHPQDLKNFAGQPEEEVAKKLHFGLGRWMTVNWGFYEGSRFSHYMKEKGITFPDDMAQLVMRLFHRHLNSQPLEEEALIASYVDKRDADRKAILDASETIEVRQRSKEE